MASSKEYLIYVLELLREVTAISYKKMMGEYIIYKKDVVVGGIYDNRFLVKKCPYSESLHLKEVIPYPSSKGLYLLDNENPDEIKEIIDNIYLDLIK